MSLWHFFLENHTEVLELTLEHLWMVGWSILFAVLIGIPLRILITRWPILNKPVLGSANIIQTIPSLALFGFLLPLPLIGGIGRRVAPCMPRSMTHDPFLGRRSSTAKMEWSSQG